MAAIGRVLVGGGVLVLLFVAFELWGTNIHEARAQHDLRRQFAPVVQSLSAPTTTSTVPLAPVPGDAVALVQIPRIGVDKAVVEGVGVGDLMRGPGHYPGTPMPGQPGNAAIAGHRTTYGAPFGRLDELEPGDDIVITTRQGRFTYKVDHSEVVKPTQTSVLDPTLGATLTLTTCNPRFRATQRLVVKAALVGTPAPAPPTVVASNPPPASEGLSGERSTRWPAALWGALAAAVALLVWLARRRFGRLVYLAGLPLFLVVLFVFYENVARLVPANL